MISGTGSQRELPVKREVLEDLNWTHRLQVSQSGLLSFVGMDLRNVTRIYVNLQAIVEYYVSPFIFS